MYCVYVCTFCQNSLHNYNKINFSAIIGNLMETKQVAGVITGKQQSGSSMYIPSIYSRSQNEWVNSFYKQNGYLGMFKFIVFHYCFNLTTWVIKYVIQFVWVVLSSFSWMYSIQILWSYCADSIYSIHSKCIRKFMLYFGNCWCWFCGL